eukprot:PhF_6_TR25172/c0_g2_i5/m.34706
MIRQPILSYLEGVSATYETTISSPSYTTIPGTPKTFPLNAAAVAHITATCNVQSLPYVNGTPNTFMLAIVLNDSVCTLSGVSDSTKGSDVGVGVLSFDSSVVGVFKVTTFCQQLVESTFTVAMQAKLSDGNTIISKPTYVTLYGCEYSVQTDIVSPRVNYRTRVVGKYVDEYDPNSWKTLIDSDIVYTNRFLNECFLRKLIVYFV